MTNPFKFGEEVSGDDFCNREEEIVELCQDIRNSTNVLVYSPRRYGKTSLIKRVISDMSEEGFITVYVDLYPAISKEKFIQIYARAVSRSVTGNVEKLISWMRESIPKLLPKIVVTTDVPTLEFEFDKSEPYAPIFSDLFRAVHNRARALRKPAVVVFDEFQEINNYADDEIEREMRSAFQAHSNVSYIFMGSKRRIMHDMFENPSRPFYRSAKHVPLSKIDEPAFAEFISSKFRSGNYAILDKHVSEILKISECHPFYTQQLCYYVWEQGRAEKTISAKSIESALERLLVAENQAFVNLWDGLTAKQRAVIVAIAKDSPVSVFSNSFLRKHSLGPASSVQKALDRLVHREVLVKENSQYAFEDVFFKRWVLATFL